MTFPVVSEDYDHRLLSCNPSGCAGLLRVCDGHRNIGFGCSRSDRAILVDAKIQIAQRRADRVRATTAAEDRPAKVIIEDIACPVPGKHSARENMLAVANPT